MDAWFSGKSTKKTLIVALWSVNTQGMQHLTLLSRWDALKSCVEYAYKLAAARLYHLGLNPKDLPLGLFVAPEYLMARQAASGMHQVGDRRHIAEDKKDILVNFYQGLSNTCQGMILVPGTIAWRKPLERTGPAKAESRYDKAITAVQSYAARRTWRVSTPADPLDRGLSRDITGHTAPTSRGKLTALNAAKAWAPNVPTWGYFDGDLRYMGRNTAYVLLDGQVICKYHKQGDFHEVLVGTDTVHIPGKLDGRFTVPTSSPDLREIRFGLEVCLDHATQTTAKEIAHLGKVDVHVISSAQVSNTEGNVAAVDSGYLVHASSNQDYTKVQKRVGSWLGATGEALHAEGYTWFGAMSDVKPFHIEKVKGAPLQLFEIELDLTRVVPTKETVEKVKGGGLLSNVFG